MLVMDQGSSTTRNMCRYRISPLPESIRNRANASAYGDSLAHQYELVASQNREVRQSCAAVWSAGKI